MTPAPMSRREMAIFALTGFTVWLAGAVMFRLGGALMFGNGPLVFALTAVGVAASVCMLLSAAMGWRKAPLSDAVTVAVVMGLPGLFCDVGYVLWFSEITGLPPITAGPFGALVLFGNAVMLTYALARATGAKTLAARQSRAW